MRAISSAKQEDARSGTKMGVGCRQPLQRAYWRVCSLQPPICRDMQSQSHQSSPLWRATKIHHLSVEIERLAADSSTRLKHCCISGESSSSNTTIKRPCITQSTDGSFVRSLVRLFPSIYLAQRLVVVDNPAHRGDRKARGHVLPRAEMDERFSEYFSSTRSPKAA